MLPLYAIAASEPIQVVFSIQATLAAGKYIYDGTLTTPVFNRPFLSNYVYLLNALTFSGSSSEEDYKSGIGDPTNGVLPKFSLYHDSAPGMNIFREPIALPLYFQNFPYPKVIQDFRVDGFLKGGITGTIVQTPSLIGIGTFTLDVILSFIEISNSKVRDQISGKA